MGTLFNPGPVGFVLGALLIVAGVKVWHRFARRRFHAEVAAELAVGRAVVPPLWHPSQGPQRRVEPVTELLPRCVDALDATQMIPRQRAVRRG
ncbi:hypothetical protein ACGFIW_02020 [Micromonospora sp. NPDC048935]|uniref:hypothetical protein n=1 Tax=Micromonospora sp. NPDC048935 TaxID=3364262 RepID=UPI00371AF681